MGYKRREGAYQRRVGNAFPNELDELDDLALHGLPEGHLAGKDVGDEDELEDITWNDS